MSEIFVGDCLFNKENGRVVAYNGTYTQIDNNNIGYKLKCMKVSGGSDCGISQCKLYEKKAVIF